MTDVDYRNYQCPSCARSISVQGAYNNARIQIYCYFCDKEYEYHHHGVIKHE